MLDPRLEYRKASGFNLDAQWFNFRLFISRVISLDMTLFEFALLLAATLLTFFLAFHH